MGVGRRQKTEAGRRRRRARPGGVGPLDLGAHHSQTAQDLDFSGYGLPVLLLSFVRAVSTWGQTQLDRAESAPSRPLDCGNQQTGAACRER
jgi:hypothetical protein